MNNYLYFFFFIILSYCSATETDNNVTISYTLWIGSLPEENTVIIHNMNITAPKNTSFYHVMEIAAKINHQHYRFKAEEYDFGHYITEIGGKAEIKEEKKHWMIYSLPSLPDSWIPPSDDLLAPVGVDLIKINNGEHYLFWLHKVKY